MKTGSTSTGILAVPDRSIASPTPSYRLDTAFEENRRLGPAFDGPWPAVPASSGADFLGLRAGSRIGVASSILLDRRWVDTYSRLGFDLLTFKTVRSVERLCHPAPNWMPCEREPLRHLADAAVPQIASAAMPDRPAEATMLGSFGIPSLPPAVWMEEMAASRGLLRDGQILIGSIAGTVGPADGEQALIDDFASLASRVLETGAQVVELNLSCPNVPGREGAVYLDAPLAGRIARAAAAAAGDTPVTVKTGYIEDDASLTALMRAVAPHIRGLVCINALSRRILTPGGAPAFGTGREQAGVMGDAIRPFACGMIMRAAAIDAAEKYGLSFIGVGGISRPAHIDEFSDAGASAFMAASAAMWNPHLAVELKQAGATGRERAA